MSEPASIDRARALRYRREAVEAGWEVPDDPIPAVSKVWTYSVSYTGEIRAAGRLLRVALDLYQRRIQRFRHLSLDDMASTAVNMLDTYPVSDRSRHTALIALSCYFMNTAAGKNLPVGALETGVHQLIVDWPHPDDPIKNVVRPAVAISPHMLKPDEVRTAIESVVEYERGRSR